MEGPEPAITDSSDPQRQGRRASRVRWIGSVVVVLIVVAVASLAALNQPGLTAFVAAGDAVTLPADGDLLPVSLENFE